MKDNRIFKYTQVTPLFPTVSEKLSKSRPKQGCSLINLFMIFLFLTQFHRSTNRFVGFLSCCCMYN